MSSAALPSAHSTLRAIRPASSVPNGTPYANLVISDRPTAYYRLNDGTATLTDSGPNRLTGVYGSATRHGGPALTADSGAQSTIFAGAPAGSDVSSAIAAVSANALFAAAVHAVTVEAWIKPAALNGSNHYVPLVSYGREAQGQAWVLQLSPQSTLNFWIKTTGGGAPFFSVKSRTPLAPGVVHQIVAVYDGANASILIDGALDSTLPATGNLDYAAIQPQWGLGIGGAPGSSEPAFDGELSDVSIYPVALPAAELQRHFAAGTTAGLAPTPAPSIIPGTQTYANLVAQSAPLAFYTLADNGPLMADSSANHLDGAYGGLVAHRGGTLTSAHSQSSVFPGGPGGSDVPSSSGVTAPSGVFATASTGLTVEAWISPADFNRTNNFMPIVSYGRGGIGNTWALQVTPESSLDFYMKVVGGANSYELTPPFAKFSPNTIYQVVATYDGVTADVYVNGLLEQSVPASGPLNYEGTAPTYGLCIGGELDTTRPIFNGAISDVSVYATALSAQTIENHYVIGHLARTLTETPTPSDTFVDSIGVVTHLRTSGTPYTDSWPTFVSLLRASGIRHIGDALITTPTWYPPRIQQLASYGIRASLITDLSQQPADITSAVTAFRPTIESIGGPNEPDISGDPNWVADTRAFQQMLWSTIKTNPNMSNLTVIGPSVLSEAHDLALGDLSAWMDRGSIHDYFSGYNPGTAGWGSLDGYGVYGSIPWDINLGAIVSGKKTLIATETGYGTSPTKSGTVDYRTLARYIPRLLLEHFIHGITRSTLYEFYDEPGDFDFSSFGLVDLTNTPKPSYYAIKGLIGLLGDPGPSFQTTPLSYVLEGDVDNVEHLLLQKRDGTYELIMWVETQSYDPNARVDLPVAPQPVSFSPSYVPYSASLATVSDSGTLVTSPVTFSGGTANISVDDRVSILTFR